MFARRVPGSRQYNLVDMRHSEIERRYTSRGIDDMDLHRRVLAIETQMHVQAGHLQHHQKA